MLVTFTIEGEQETKLRKADLDWFQNLGWLLTRTCFFQIFFRMYSFQEILGSDLENNYVFQKRMKGTAEYRMKHLCEPHDRPGGFSSRNLQSTQELWINESISLSDSFTKVFQRKYNGIATTKKKRPQMQHIQFGNSLHRSKPTNFATVWNKVQHSPF